MMQAAIQASSGGGERGRTGIGHLLIAAIIADLFRRLKPPLPATLRSSYAFKSLQYRVGWEAESMGEPT
jgi:hypothetical protein